MRIPTLLLALGCLVLGCGAGATLTPSQAQSSSGTWTCYQTSELRSPIRASMGDASSYSRSLNEIAPQAPVGTLIEFEASGSESAESYLCSRN